MVDFLDKVNFYIMAAVQFFKSMWPEVRGNAALFVGKGLVLQFLIRAHLVCLLTIRLHDG